MSLDEYKSIISTKKNSAPGLDQIPYALLQNLPILGTQILLNIFNKCLESGEIPQQWKDTLILPIIKPNKDKLVVSNYRPIALSSCVGKTFESILKN